ncbi:hypothetical protein E4U44_002406 [Claviceps purpurea]|nr:hypothetical protein E4U44_002406 [Claviceps purpurea]
MAKAGVLDVICRHLLRRRTLLKSLAPATLLARNANGHFSYTRTPEKIHRGWERNRNRDTVEAFLSAGNASLRGQKAVGGDGNVTTTHFDSTDNGMKASYSMAHGLDQYDEVDN